MTNTPASDDPAVLCTVHISARSVGPASLQISNNRDRKARAGNPLTLNFALTMTRAHSFKYVAFLFLSPPPHALPFPFIDALIEMVLFIVG